MVTQIIDTSSSDSETFSLESTRAGRLGPAQRRGLSVEALARREPISCLAQRYQVSRKFVYRQASKASEALDEAFTDPAQEDSVLFYLPVTKAWIRQFVLALLLICHSSFRGVVEVLADLFDYDLSIATVHNIVQEAIKTARVINDGQELSGIRVGAHDEIFQAGKPILVGADLESTYCYLLAEEDHRDETTWGVHLLDLSERGLRPDYTIADGGRGLRAGQAAAWDQVPCHADVFHAERDLGTLAYFLENRAVGCMTAREKLERKMARGRKKGRGQTLSKRLALARQAEARAVPLAQDIRTLADWMKNDVLALAGPDLATRRELFDFIVEELRDREELCPHRIRPIRQRLEHQRDHLLAFAGVLDQRFADLAIQLHLSATVIHAMCELQGKDRSHPAYWQAETRLRQILRHHFHPVQTAVRQIMAETPRASSIVENLNSRLRNYFFLRRQVGNGYLDLLRFFLNHHRFLRSDRPERVGKSPAELLNGTPCPHWLELLGFQRFSRN